MKLFILVSLVFKSSQLYIKNKSQKLNFVQGAP